MFDTHTYSHVDLYLNKGTSKAQEQWHITQKIEIFYFETMYIPYFHFSISHIQIHLLGKSVTLPSEMIPTDLAIALAVIG